MSQAVATPLEAEIARLIALDGPISVARFMALCLGHPTLGYYRTRDPIGSAGDFITAPEVSQMYGELIGLWAAQVWRQMGAPPAIRLIELGPGRGTLMADALRAGRALPGFLAAVSVDLVETSPVLRARQAQALRARAGDIGARLSWHDGVEAVPEGPAIVLANEFFDALPVRQLVRDGGAWRERLVGRDAAGALCFGLSPDPVPGVALPAPEGAVLECADAAHGVFAGLARRITRWGGAALAIDYGHVASGYGDTLQAVRRHRMVGVLDDPGEADLTTHVDFAALGRIGVAASCRVHGPAEQGAFLHALGIAARAARLTETADATGRAAIATALSRLTGDGPDDMGRLFKAMAITSGVADVPGFG